MLKLVMSVIGILSLSVSQVFTTNLIVNNKTDKEITVMGTAAKRFSKTIAAHDKESVVDISDPDLLTELGIVESAPSGILPEWLWPSPKPVSVLKEVLNHINSRSSDYHDLTKWDLVMTIKGGRGGLGFEWISRERADLLAQLFPVVKMAQHLRHTDYRSVLFWFIEICPTRRR